MANRLAIDNPPPPPPQPQPQPHAVFVEQLYLDPPPPPRRRELTFLCRTLYCGLLVFLFAASFSLIMWVIFHPIFPSINVSSAAMSPVAFTGTAVTAALNLTLILSNPNHHLTTIYDHMEISLIYPSRNILLSLDYPPPFVQPKRSRTSLATNLSFNGVNLGIEPVNDIKHDLYSGSLSFGLKILATVKYRNGKWKTRSQYLRAYCGGVSFAFTSIDKPGIFLNPYQDCEVAALWRLPADHLKLLLKLLIGNFLPERMIYGSYAWLVDEWKDRTFEAGL